MSNIILQTFGPRIHEAVSDKARMDGLVNYIGKFMGKNHEIVFDQGPNKKLLFSNQDEKVILDFVGTTPEEVKSTLKHVDDIKSSWRLLNEPYIILSCYVIRELEIQKKTQYRDLVLMYLGMKVYSGLFNKYFKYGVNKEIMLYTLNDLSDKFKYKTLKNNYAVYKDVIMQSHSVYDKVLVKGSDDMITIYFAQIYGRLNKVMMNIAKLYYKNRDEKKYLNTVSGFDDETGEMVEYDNSSSLVNSITDSAASYFISSNVNMDIVRQVSNRNSIPSGTIYQTLITIKKEEPASSIVKLCNLIVSVIYDADPSLLTRVKTKEFILTGIKQLSVSNSSNKNLAELKSKLDYLLNEYCSKYAATQRAATKMSYRSAIYSYFVYILVISNGR